MAIETILTLEDVRQQREGIMALARQHRAREVAVFGSLVRGGLRADNDIDFLVDFEAGYKLRDLIRLTQALGQLLGRRAEVVERQSLRPELRKAVFEQAQLL